MNSEKIRKILGNPMSNSYKVFWYLATHQEDCFIHKTTMAKNLKIPYTTLNYQITKFKGEGLIKQDFNLTLKGIKLFEYIWNHKDIDLLRAHNIQIIFYLSHCPRNYVELYSNSIFTEFTNKRYRGLKGDIDFDFGKITMQIYSRKKILCVFRDIYGESDEEISSAVQTMITYIQERIEKDFPGIKIHYGKPAKIQTSHIAYLNSTLAQQFDLEGYTYEGKEVAVDKSHGKPELELTNPKNNLRGIGIIKLLEKNLQENEEI